MAVLSIGQVWAGETTYTFTAKTWTATSGGSNADWTSGQDGAGFSNNGIQVTANSTGANGTSPISFTNVTKVECIYNTNKSAGAGSFDVKVGNNSAQNVTCEYSGSSDGRTANFKATVNYATAQTGNVNIKINTTTNSIYLVSVTITTSDSGDTPSKQDLGADDLKWSADAATVTIGGNNNVYPTLTLKQGLSVTYESTATTVAEIGETSGTITLKKAGTTTIKAVFAGDDTYNAKTVSYDLTVNPAPLVPIVGAAVDVLTAANFTATGSSYTAFSNVQAANEGHSDAVYLGKTAKNGNNIQINSISSGNAGREIATSESGGTIKRLEVTWGSGNNDSRNVMIYGSHNAYDATETSKTVTNLGSITYHTGDVSGYVDIDDSEEAFEYIQITASGAMYVSEMRISWMPAEKYAINIASVTNGTLVVKDGDDAITSGAEFTEGKTLTVIATPNDGFKLDGIKVIETGSNPENDVTSTVLAGTTLTVPAYAVTISAEFSANVAPFATLTLSEIGEETVYYDDDSKREGDIVSLPLTAASCSKVFVGWDPNVDCATEPTYAPGADFTLGASASNKLYAVYATPIVDTESEPVLAQTLQYDTWTYSGTTTNKSSYRLFGNGAYVESAEFDLSLLAKVKVFGGTFGGQDTYKTGTIGDGTNTWKSIELTGNGNAKEHEFIEGNALSGNGKLYVTSTCGNGTDNGLRISKVEIYTYPVTYANYSTACMAQVATPTFSPAAGTYTAVQNVTISCATSGATIYYTTDGTTPSTSSTLYGSAITVDANMTIKAIAVKSEMANSAVATAEYEINLPLSTVDAIFAKAKEVKSTETDVTVTFGNWVVSATKDANAYVTDGTKGFIIYANNHGFNVGDVLSGTANCKVKMYAGSAELTTLTSETAGLTVTPNGSVDAATKTIADLDSINTGALVVLNGLFYNGSKLVDASENEITPYSTFYSEMASKLEENHVYNITGIYVQYYATKEIAPRAAADIVDATEYVKVSFDANANDATGDLPEDVTGLIAGHNTYTIPTEKPLTRDAYLQIGWNTNKDATEALEGNLTNITTNTTLYAIWTAKETCAITFYDRGNVHAEKAPYQGVEYTIDVAPSELPSGYTFAGWSADPITTEVTSAELVTTITPASATMSLYAVYTRSEGEEVITYNKVTETPTDWAGKYLIVSEDFNVAFDGSLETLDAADDVIEVTINEGVIAGSAKVNAAVFTVAAATTNYSIRSASGFYIGQTANSNGLLSSTTTVYTNTLAISEGDAVITSSGNPTLRYNKASDQNRFRYYKSGQQPVQLYKQHVTLPTVYYTTAPVSRYTVSFNLAEDEQGSFSDISVVQGEDATLPAAVPTKLHYTFNKWKDANNNEYAAEATIENVTSNIVLSATWTENSKANVTFDANGGSDVAAINDVYEGETYTLPDAPAYGTNIFGGWKVGDNVYAAGTEMTMSTPADPIEYVAQWTVVPEFNAGYWFKVTDASTLAAGQFVMIVAEDDDYALGATQNSNNRSADAISKTATPAAAYYATAPAILLLQNGVADDQFGLYVTNGETKGYLYAAASGSNHMKTQEALDVNASWKIAIENGVTTVIATGSENRNNLLYNSGSVIFSCYTGTSSSIKNVAIYRYEESNKLQVSYAGKGTEHVQGALVDAGGSVTLAAAPAAPEAEDVTYSFVSWVVDSEEYAPAAEIANITENKVVYAKWNVVTNPEAEEITIPVEDVVASDIHVKENQTVTVEVTEDVTLGNLDLENGAILEFEVAAGKTVEANDLILRSSSASNGVEGMSSQAPVMPVVNGVLALEIQLRPDEMNAENSSLWYCIAAPFDVDINNGFEWVHPNGSRTPMVHNVDFQIFAYDGARRATGISGWQRTSGTMKAGVAHFIGFDNARPNQNTIRLTAKTNTVAPATEIALGSYPGATEYQNWNGVANPTLQYIGINKDIVAFDYGIQDYNTYANTAYNYFVGSPFFIQQDGGSIAVDHNDRGGAIHAPKRVEDKLEYCVRINAAGAKSFESQMYVRASETASSEYEEGHDLASQSSTTPKYGARIWSENYNMRLGIEEAQLTNGNASYVLGIATPAAGEYTISVAAPKENATLYLTYNGSIIWNLSNGAYTIDLPKGITSGYGLVMQAKAPQVGTDIESQTAIVNGVEKVVINNTIYILRDQQMYDLTGKMVK